MIFEHDRGHERNKAVSVDRLSSLVHRPGAVDVGIKYDAEVCVVFLHSGDDCVHGLFIFRVRNMVRK